MPAPGSPEQLLATAHASADTSEALALVGIGLTLQEVVDELRTQTLVAYLQALILNPRPDPQTASQIESVASVLERRLGFTPAEAES